MSYSNLCEIHKNEIAITHCIRCGSTMCKRCMPRPNTKICPDCSGVNIKKIEKDAIRLRLRNIVFAGMASCGISVLINTLTDNYENLTANRLMLNSIIFLMLGISFASALYFTRDNQDIKDFSNVPIFKSTLVKYILLASTLTGIPILYFIYLIIKYLKSATHN